MFTKKEIWREILESTSKKGIHMKPKPKKFSEQKPSGSDTRKERKRYAEKGSVSTNGKESIGLGD